MPFYKSYSPNSSTSIKVWKISESYQELLSTIDLTNETMKKLNNSKSINRKREILLIKFCVFVTF